MSNKLASNLVLLSYIHNIREVDYSVYQSKCVIRLQTSWYSRELLSRVKAYLDVTFKPKLTYLLEVIPIIGDGYLSWMNLIKLAQSIKRKTHNN